ncbi:MULTISPECIES: alpha amylase N-terminal ig-like domain-containing protein [unclassified Paenibacillus]|uniref:alpha amylase N-terminal ig-like domain-containing protein n=1 Tax=unclassified Paenibacillus TaxID=185978 RepID=UPI002404F39E|nr:MULTISPECIES: alpha amylase N-terminal ig-like domain-containing protein [unclassified Paenibacillus]MDF9842787.1 cyclomaltodextrinase [Paenibacillus sp. PastF-2]MDF9849345.1 cyclomaltodextrinase [Paenibacillus sp. PastM-2]MDF9855947.1 cyclomaltodextrinase [Paenibacillus sp. PastF-1]MDH6481186.1 cyclomaltodextrinase [Paenibacillus sp. PastH-2]MDH6508606.1 cyclomaltodextrinase [Paenibacillus sp. PastM-3]
MPTRWFFHHTAEDPFAFPDGKGALKLRLFVPAGLQLCCTVIHSDRYDSPGSEQPLLMERIGSAGAYELHEAVIRTATGRCRYVFHASDPAGNYAWYGERGVAGNREHAGAFQYAYMHRPEALAVPSWTSGTIVYQIYPSSYNQGTLRGITDKIPYLQELGVTAVYMTPIFESPSEHKYNTSDYYRIDPAFGTAEDLKKLVEEAHRHGIRVMLDAVFNHAGDTFFAFRDVLEKGEQSRYKDWFFIRSYPVSQLPAPAYETFAKAEAHMPKLNMDNPETADYMLAVAKHWIREAGIDGWRLDVANEVNPQFWTRLRRELKAEFPDLLLIGEIMHASGSWLRGDQFDGGMNYVLREAVLEFFALQSAGPVRFMEQLLHIEALYNDQANSAMFQLLGSHDTERFLTACKENGRGWNRQGTALARMRLAVFFQMTYIGIPMIYYGDEVGMEGATDPHCRKPMLWLEQEQNRELYEWYKTLIALRKQHVILQKGAFRPWFTDEVRGVLGFVRRWEQDKVAVLINNSPNAYQLELNSFRSDKKVLTELLSGLTIRNTGKMLVELEPFGCMLLY